MANTNSPFGFRHCGYGDGAHASMGQTRRMIASGNTTKIYFGDPVKDLNTGYIAQWTAGTNVAQLAGVFGGCKYLNSVTGSMTWSDYWPGANAAADATAYIIPVRGNPVPRFIVQSSGTAITLADKNINADVSIGTGTITGGHGLSGASLDQSTLATTATLPFRIVDVYGSSSTYPGVGGLTPISGQGGADSTSSYNWVIVEANTGLAGI